MTVSPCSLTPIEIRLLNPLARLILALPLLWNVKVIPVSPVTISVARHRLLWSIWPISLYPSSSLPGMAQHVYDAFSRENVSLNQSPLNDIYRNDDTSVLVHNFMHIIESYPPDRA